MILQNAYEKNGTQMKVQEGSALLSRTHEILIGETGRPETETARKWMGGDSIIVTVINETIVILGSTPANTLLGAETFVKKYLQGLDMSIARSTKAAYGLKSELAYGEYVNGTINANDPWVVQDGEHYYYCWSDQGGVCGVLRNIGRCGDRLQPCSCGMASGARDGIFAGTLGA